MQLVRGGKQLDTMILSIILAANVSASKFTAQKMKFSAENCGFGHIY